MHINNNHILVVGGAGYIGSHMVLHLKAAGYNPIVLDNLSTGHEDAVLDAKLIIGDLQDQALLDSIFSEYQITAVMHFAGFIQVGESVIDPAKYYINNLANTITLLSLMVKHKIKNFVFSSTAAVYGDPKYTPIDEKHPVCPVNPYGQTKRMVEQVLEDFSKAYRFNFIALRYFNAAGADPEGRLHERHIPETHLIPLIIDAVAQGKSIPIFGNDYETLDGTCVRDYIHVSDLCSAHLLALDKLLKSHEPIAKIYNLGTGNGYSVKEVIDQTAKLLATNVEYSYQPRRPGDPATLVADPRLAMQELGWKPIYSDLINIIEDAAAHILSNNETIS